MFEAPQQCVIIVRREVFNRIPIEHKESDVFIDRPVWEIDRRGHMPTAGGTLQI
jgi:hypothetical protein